MQLRRNILELFEAIPDRIEVSGHEPTWQVTGGSFDDAVSFANDAFDQPVVIARQDRRRWWPRVTLTVTTDPALAADAPPLAELAVDPEPPPEPDPEPAPEAEPEPEPQADPDEVFAFLEDVFDRQASRALPEQRRGE
jgi:hypothetical protein